MSVYAPSGLTLTQATVYWYVPHQSSGADMFAEEWSGSTEELESGAPYDARYTPDTHTLPPGATNFSLMAYCSSDDGPYGCEFPSGQTPEIQMFGSAITVSDNTPPTGSATGGALTGSGPFSGSQSIAYSASDSLSGIHSVTLEIDGKPVATHSYSGECPNTTFLACPASQSGSLTWNTASVAPGPHEVALSIENAAGDTTVIDDHAVTIANQLTQTSSGPDATRGAPNGTNASDQAKLTARWVRTPKMALTERYGTRERTTGTLTTTSGQPITGASLDIYAIPAYQGAHAQSLGSVQTGTTGDWTLTLPVNIPSATISFAYRSHVNDTVPVATATLELDVHAGLTLHIAPRVTSVGRKIFFSGVLHGAPIPLGGKQLVLEASSGGEWIQFDTLGTNAKGPLPRELSLQVSRSSDLQVPRNLPSRSGLPVPGRRLQQRCRARALNDAQLEPRSGKLSSTSRTLSGSEGRGWGRTGHQLFFLGRYYGYTQFLKQCMRGEVDGSESRGGS